MGEEKTAVDKRPTDNLEAYDMYLQGNYLRNQGGKENLDKSIEFYKRALEIDPNYALAYSGWQPVTLHMLPRGSRPVEM